MWEIPVSAWGLPFLSNTERLCGLTWMRWFFKMLHLEARVTSKPIVFVFHPEDLNAERGVEPYSRLTWRHVIPTWQHGFLFRFLLFERDWRRVARDVAALMTEMETDPATRCLTVSEYWSMLEGDRSHTRVTASGFSRTEELACMR